MSFMMLLLPYLVIFNGLALPLGDVSLKADQLAACLMLVPLAAATLIGARRLVIDSTMCWLAAILAMNVVSSLLNSPTLGYSLGQCANLASVMVIYLLVVNFVDTPERVQAFVRHVLRAAIIAGVIAIVAFALASAGLDVGGAEVSETAATRFTQAYGAYGVMVEPNLLGSFAAAHLVFAAAILAGSLQSANEDIKLARWTAGVSGVALVVAFTRAAWVGAMAGLVIVAAFNAKALITFARARRMMTPFVGAIAVGVLLFMVPSTAGTLFRFKLANIVNVQTQTAVVRAITYSIALDQTTVHPWVGWGTFTFAPLTAQGADFQQFENWRNLWIGNYVLLALHDTGIIGLLLWCSLLWSIIARGFRAVRESHMLGVPIVAAFVTLLLPFLATSGFSLGFPWLLAGLVGAHARVVSARRSPTALGVPHGRVDAAEQAVSGVVPSV